MGPRRLVFVTQYCLNPNIWKMQKKVHVLIYFAFCFRPKTEEEEKPSTRLPGAAPQPIGLFLFCIEFGWG